jgi:hypothetical protein
MLCFVHKKIKKHAIELLGDTKMCYPYELPICSRDRHTYIVPYNDVRKTDAFCHQLISQNRQ